MYNLIIRSARNLLKTQVTIKIESHPFHPINLDWILWRWSEKKNFKKTIRNDQFEKTEFFKSTNFQFIVFIHIPVLKSWWKKILRLGEFEKISYFESAILNFFNDLFCFIPVKISQKGLFNMYPGGIVDGDFLLPNEIDSWNFQHMLYFSFCEASQNLSSFR